MTHSISKVLTATVLTSACLFAQSTMTVPRGAETVDANSSSPYAWNSKTTPMRVQYLYDSVHLTDDAYPLLINKLRWRANGTSSKWTGGTYANVKIDLSSSPIDWYDMTTVFDQNHGTDQATVYAGAVTILPGSGTSGQPGSWYVEVFLDKPFYYDPTKSKDLLVDISVDGQWAGNGGLESTSTDAMSGSGASTSASRMYSYGDHLAAVGSAPTRDMAVIMEVGYRRAVGVLPSFTAEPTRGASPLTVQFTDNSFTSDPSGIIARAWDFDADGVYDSGEISPSFTYFGGSWTVSLVVTDSSNVPYVTTRSDLILVDVPEAAFAADIRVAAIGQPVQFSDTSINSPTSWAWDLTGDGKIDSTDAAPVYRYMVPGAYTVTLTVGNQHGTDTVTEEHFIEIGTIPIPDHGYTRTDAWRTQGFHFTAPVAFSITALEIPADAGSGLQNVTVVRAASPTDQQGTTLLEITGVSAGTSIPCAISFAKGDEVLIFNGIGDANQLVCSTGVSLGTSLFGHPIRLETATYNQNIVKLPVSSQQATFYQSTGSTVGRIHVTISTALSNDYGVGTPTGSGNSAPQLTSLSLPRLGTTSELEFTQYDAGSHAAALIFGLGRTALPTPIGTIHVGSIIGQISLPGLLGASPATVSLLLPDDPALVTGGSITLQGIVLRPGTTNGLSLTNGTEWVIGY